MEWEEVSDYCIASGEYRIARGIVHGKPWFMLYYGKARLTERHDHWQPLMDKAERHKKGLPIDDSPEPQAAHGGAKSREAEHSLPQQEDLL